MAHQQESFLSFSSRQSLSCFLSCMAKRSTPKPYGPLLFTTESHGPLFSPEPHGPLYSLSEPRGPLSPMAAAPRFKSQRPSSFAAPFLTPPTFSYTCQHPRILPALLGCHCKFGQVWPHGMEPIISKLSHRPCNQGELLPSPILGGTWSHPPGSKHGHSYLTHPGNQLKVVDMLNDRARG